MNSQPITLSTSSFGAEFGHARRHHHFHGSHPAHGPHQGGYGVAFGRSRHHGDPNYHHAPITGSWAGHNGYGDFGVDVTTPVSFVLSKVPGTSGLPLGKQLDYPLLGGAAAGYAALKLAHLSTMVAGGVGLAAAVGLYLVFKGK